MNRSIVTIEDLTNGEIIELFARADFYIETHNEDKDTYRLRKSTAEAVDHIAATLFFEPSTRTRLSFETAMLRLGGKVISFADAKTTSSAKGESLADTIRVVQTYADIIVLRHPYEGAARVAADFAKVPVINAGDGSHEHPTQTLCDLYTLYRQYKNEDPALPAKHVLEGRKVLISGDLKNGRTVHSLVYGLARLGAKIFLNPVKGFELPTHVIERLENDYLWNPAEGEKVDVVYVSPEEPHQLSLISKIDVYYMTRLQVERLVSQKAESVFPVIDAKFLDSRGFKDIQVMHPLPRVNELGYDLDDDPRGAYFRQTAYGVPIRMALLSALLDLGTEKIFHGKGRCDRPYYMPKQGGIRCEREACILSSETEQRYLRPRLWIVESKQPLFQPIKLRCIYCEVDYTPAAMGDTSNMKYTIDFKSSWQEIPEANRVFFESITQAKELGFKEVDSLETTPLEAAQRGRWTS